jgi:formylmethanofuran dehydrogenase subunit C
MQIHGGAVTIEGNVTNVTVENGTVYLKEDADITNLTMNGGVVHSQGRGSITTATVNSGLLNMKGNASRTITTLQINPGGQISYDPTAVTITNRSAPSRAIQISTSER